MAIVASSTAGTTIEVPREGSTPSKRTNYIGGKEPSGPQAFLVHEVAAPRMEVVDAAGAGDSFVGAFCSVLARGGSVDDAAMLGAAAGAQNVTRHGLGTGEAATIERLRQLVVMRPLPGAHEPRVPPTGSARVVTLDELAHQVQEATS